jgi:hypothetical protein
MNKELRELARAVAEWHLADNDECGVIARRLFDLLKDENTGRCIKCKHRKTTERDYGYCGHPDMRDQSDAFHGGQEEKPTGPSMHYLYDEGGVILVDDDFGCVRWEPKP